MINIVHSPVAQCSAVTALFLALSSAGSICGVSQYHYKDPWKGWLWAAIFGLILFSAGAGAVYFGIDISFNAKIVLRQILLFCSVQFSAFLIVAAVDDYFGRYSAKRICYPLISVATAFCFIAFIFQESITLFAYFELPALLFAFFIYLRLELRTKPGAGWILLGVLLTLIAHFIQKNMIEALTLGHLFDKNSAFYIFQILALINFTKGIRKSLRLQ